MLRCSPGLIGLVLHQRQCYQISQGQREEAVNRMPGLTHKHLFEAKSPLQFASNVNGRMNQRRDRVTLEVIDCQFRRRRIKTGIIRRNAPLTMQGFEIAGITIGSQQTTAAMASGSQLIQLEAAQLRMIVSQRPDTYPLNT